MAELSRPFEDYLHALLRERGVEGLEGLATLLERAAATARTITPPPERGEGQTPG